MRLSNLVSGILFALGVLCFIGANVALSEDKGSCVPGLVCDHTFAGTNIYILPVVRLLEALSILAFGARSEEHTSELQSQSNLVCRLLLEKKKKPALPERRLIMPVYATDLGRVL